jgi:hypothetical protein
VITYIPATVERKELDNLAKVNDNQTLKRCLARAGLTMMQLMQLHRAPRSRGAPLIRVNFWMGTLMFLLHNTLAPDAVTFTGIHSACIHSSQGSIGKAARRTKASRIESYATLDKHTVCACARFNELFWVRFGSFHAVSRTRLWKANAGDVFINKN